MKRFFVMLTSSLLFMACSGPTSNVSPSTSPTPTVSPTVSSSPGAIVGLATKQQILVFLQCKADNTSDNTSKASLEGNIQVIKNMPDGQWPLVAESYTSIYNQLKDPTCM